MADNTKRSLDPSAILHQISQNVTALKNPYDAIAVATHAIMLDVGFRFAGIGDDARQEGDGQTVKLPEGWNSNGPHSYNFRYSHPQSSLTFIIKVVRLGDKCVILGLGIGDNKTAILDVLTEDYTSESFYPYDSTKNEPLVHGFISSSRFEDFIKSYKLNILQRLIPGLNKPGYEDTSSREETRQRHFPPPSNIPSQPSGDHPTPMFPDVGSSDLNPLGNDGIGGGVSMPGRGSGMYVGPDHPIFGSRSGDDLEDPTGIYGGPQPLPRGAVPPGARFDPIGPFGRPPVRPPSGRGRSGPRRLFPGEPNNDELPPPGFGDMFG
ncbi:PI31 proteasome regulator N-terminal-domain-containing protein [Mycotypha africana]|uniref:PI31 proteasome regulator N-terminal-domain-containing protein n=1 Tax=Mycotypha africana TaxID=64632 RepID=UPI0023003E84|nr:PI31 proteasome regulator N-terminal-domain-containing protein [Mycotypha africana]KAI8979785.1 PI31 proteasome regulator N-terminal-domain-containing protein [Mycotypha africana]